MFDFHLWEESVKGAQGFDFAYPAILSKRSASKDFRTGKTVRISKVRRSFDALRSAQDDKIVSLIAMRRKYDTKRASPVGMPNFYFALTLVPMTSEISVTVMKAWGSMAATRFLTLGIWKRLTTK